MTGQGQQGAAQNDAGPPSATDEPAADTATEAPAPRARVVLVGPPGSGKSTIGRKLARELGVELYDTDAGIEAETGRGIPEIFATDGEPEFRRIEEQVVRRAVLEHEGVVSLGGGSVLSGRTRAVLRGATVVYLEISIGEGLRRTGSSTARPLLNGADPAAKYRELMQERRPLYKEVATVRVRTDGRSPGRVVRMILARLGLESVRTDVDPQRRNGNASAASGSVTSRPGGGSNRSRVRRQSRARAAAARRAGTEQSGAVDPAVTADSGRNRSGAPRSETDTPGGTTRSGQGEQRPANSRRSRRTRSRRGGARIRSAAANREAANRTAAQGERGSATGAAIPATTRNGSPESTGHRGGSGQPAPDRAGAASERTRRTKPRRRGRRPTNDQKESEQRT